MTARHSSYDLVVLGSGPAGIRAAVQSAKLGKSVLLVEKNPGKLGGAWLHTGTVPSKTLRETLAAINAVGSHVGREWVGRIGRELTMKHLLQRASQVSSVEEQLVRDFLGSNRIQIIHGEALIEDDHLVRVNAHEGPSQIISARFVFIATGSRPRRPDNLCFDAWRIVDSDDVLHLDAIPKQMVIYGGGVIGCEYACIFQVLGTEVTLVDSRDRIMDYLDNQIVDELRKAMESLGVKIALGRELLEARTRGSRVHVLLSGAQSIETDVLFFSAGRIPNTDRLGLEKRSIQLTSRGHVVVNQDFQTDIPHIYAAGDVIGPPALASTASEQGRHAACHMFGVATRRFPDVFPIGVYTIPEMSSVGKSEQQLLKEGVEYVTGIAHYREIARGNIRGDRHGMLKILVCRLSQRLLGIHVVGEDACNLVHIGMAFMQTGSIAQDLVSMIFNFPTLAEGYRIAAFNALNKIFIDGVIKDPKAELGSSVDRAAGENDVLSVAAVPRKQPA